MLSTTAQLRTLTSHVVSLHNLLKLYNLHNLLGPLVSTSIAGALVVDKALISSDITSKHHISTTGFCALVAHKAISQIHASNLPIYTKLLFDTFIVLSALTVAWKGKDVFAKHDQDLYTVVKSGMCVAKLVDSSGVILGLENAYNTSYMSAAWYLLTHPQIFTNSLVVSNTRITSVGNWENSIGQTILSSSS